MNNDVPRKVSKKIPTGGYKATGCTKGITQKDVLHMSREEFKNSPTAQEDLFERAQKLRQAMEDFAANTIASHGMQDATFVAILKRNNFDEFVGGILEKMQRKDYKTVSQMDDIARGRFNLQSEDDVIKMVDALEASGEFDVKVNTPKVVNGVKGGYPRYHAIVSDPKTGMTFEWQVGTQATTTVYEHADPGIPLHGVKLKDGMQPNLHDINYDVFSFMQKSDDPEIKKLADELELKEFDKKVALLAKDSSVNGHKHNNAYWQAQTNELHKEAGEKLKSIVDKKGTDFVEGFFH